MNLIPAFPASEMNVWNESPVFSVIWLMIVVWTLQLIPQIRLLTTICRLGVYGRHTQSVRHCIWKLEALVNLGFIAAAKHCIFGQEQYCKKKTV